MLFFKQNAPIGARPVLNTNLGSMKEMDLKPVNFDEFLDSQNQDEIIEQTNSLERNSSHCRKNKVQLYIGGNCKPF